MQLRPLCKELQEKAIKELNEVPSRVEDDIRHIQEWIEQQPHLNAKPHPQWILSYLRGSKFSLERTKARIDSYYTMRTMAPELFKNRDPLLPEIQEYLNIGVGVPLNKTIGPGGPRIFFGRAGLVSTFDTKTVAKAGLMLADFLFMDDDNFIIGGQQLFMDCKNASYDVALRAMADLNEARRLQLLAEPSYPTRPQSLDIINAPWFAASMYNLVQPFIPSKFKKRLTFHTLNNFDEVYNIIPRSHMPKEYGGDGESLEELKVYWKKKIESYRDWFLEDEKYCTDESKRIGKSSNYETSFGSEGSFRKLDLD